MSRRLGPAASIPAGAGRTLQDGAVLGVWSRGRCLSQPGHGSYCGLQLKRLNIAVPQAATAVAALGTLGFHDQMGP